MNAGSKAVNDASKIFKSLGYEGLLPKVDIKNKYNEIEKDLITNQADVFLRYNYFKS